MPVPQTEVGEIILSRYGDVSPKILRVLVNYFVESRRMFGGDLDKTLIVGVIALRTVAWPKFQSRSAEEMLEMVEEANLGINVQSIADSTGIPRETARRKVAELQELGWIERRPSGWTITGKGGRDLTEHREAMLNMIRKLTEIADELRRESEAPVRAA